MIGSVIGFYFFPTSKGKGGRNGTFI